MMRVTTNSTLYSYQRNMLKTSNQLYSAMNTIMTGRNFDSYAADPAAATRAFQLHSSLNATSVQASNNDTVHKKFSTAWDIADNIINELVTDLAKVPALDGISEEGLTNLNTNGQVMYAGAESIVQSLNSKYDGNYLFNGTDTKNPPFDLETAEDGKTYVTYRNVRIDDPNEAYYEQAYVDADGNNVFKADGVTPMTNGEMLAQWSDEHQYVDIGMGFAVDADGKVIESTAFDSSISGLDFTGGYGLDEDGDPKNVISIMVRMSEIFQGYNAETKEWSSAGDMEDARRLMSKLDAAHEELSAQHTELETTAKFLESNQTQLNDSFLALNTELLGIEQVDQVEAILTLSSSQTTYRAALQVGANVIPQSLMDYLN